MKTRSIRPLYCGILAVVLTLVIWLTTVAIASYRPSTGNIDVSAGSVTFRDHCGACHVMEKGITTHHGPNLYGFGKLAGERKPGMTAAEYILESILEPNTFVHPDNHRGMPKSLAKVMSPSEIRGLIAYVISSGGTPDYDEIQSLEVPDYTDDVDHRVIRRADMELAAAVLRDRGECLQCHSLFRNAEYTVFAPGLIGVGLSDASQLRTSIVEPNRDVSPYHRWVNVLLVDGQVATGKLISQDAERLVLLTRATDGQLEPVEIKMEDVDVEDDQSLIIPSQASPMPTGFDKLLTDRELDVLIQMLRQLN